MLSLFIFPAFIISIKAVNDTTFFVCFFNSYFYVNMLVISSENIFIDA